MLTPVATPVNLMLMRPAGYRFGDYWKLGLPLLGLYFVVAVFLVPAIWSVSDVGRVPTWPHPATGRRRGER